MSKRMEKIERGEIERGEIERGEILAGLGWDWDGIEGERQMYSHGVSDGKCLTCSRCMV